jgi:hypothetical protein
VNQLASAVQQIRSAFITLKIPAKDLEPGESELGVLVPRVAVHNYLGEFADELDELRFILAIFQEVVTGKREDFEIRTISSSDLSVYLEIMPPVAACIAIALDRLIETYKKILEIRKLHGELKNQKVPEEHLKGIEQHANEAMEKGIDKLIPVGLDTYCKAKAERRNELANGLRISLNKMANRIDRGYNFEIRVQPIKEAKTDGDPNAEYINAILQTSKTLEFMKVEGPPVLSLPETKSEKRESKTSQKRSPKKPLAND